MSSTIPEEVLKKIIETAGYRYPATFTDALDGSLNNTRRAAFLRGAEFMYSLRPELGSDVASDNNTSQASVASHSCAAPTQSSEEETQDDLWNEIREHVLSGTGASMRESRILIEVLSDQFTIQRKSK